MAYQARTGTTTAAARCKSAFAKSAGLQSEVAEVVAGRAPFEVFLVEAMTSCGHVSRFYSVQLDLDGGAVLLVLRSVSWVLMLEELEATAERRGLAHFAMPGEQNVPVPFEYEGREKKYDESGPGSSYFVRDPSTRRAKLERDDSPPPCPRP